MNEDEFVFPEAWRRHLHPRRGGTPGPALTIEPRRVEIAVARLVEVTKERVTCVLGHPASDRSIADAAQTYLAGGRDATPLGAGAAAAALAFANLWGRAPGLTTVADQWITDHGPVFAAQATAEMAGLFIGNPHNISGPLGLDHIARLTPQQDVRMWINLAGRPLIGRVRAHVA